MVQGVSRQVVLVRPGESDLFEQAIFLVRGDRLENSEITGEVLLRQAEKAAAGCTVSKRAARPLGMLFGALLGGGLVGLLWLLCSII